MNKMYNVKNKLSCSREKCIGLTEEIYELADYMVQVVDDSISPEGLVMLLTLVLDDIENEKNSYYGVEFSEYIKKHRKEVLSQAYLIPQIIDAISNKDFAEDFRNICKELLQYDPPRYKSEKT